MFDPKLWVGVGTALPRIGNQTEIHEEKGSLVDTRVGCGAQRLSTRRLSLGCAPQTICRSVFQMKASTRPTHK